MHLRTLSTRGLAAALGAILASCAGSSPPPPPMASREPPRSSAASPALASQAAAFESFTRRASEITPGFSSPAAIAQGLQTGAAYEPRQLEAGMIAYAAMAAMQEPAFVAGVRARGRDLARRLAVDPDAALSLPGGMAAAARANAALHRRGDALADAGGRVKQASYSVQHQAWSRARVPNGPQRLAQVKRISSVGYQRSDGDNARLFAALSEGGRRGGPSPVVSRGVALAALTILGQEAQGRALLSEARSGMCIRMAKLNYHQCLASAGTHYEDIYCLGVHAMAETGKCVADATKPARVASR